MADLLLRVKPYTRKRNAVYERMQNLISAIDSYKVLGEADVTEEDEWLVLRMRPLTGASVDMVLRILQVFAGELYANGMRSSSHITAEGDVAGPLYVSENVERTIPDEVDQEDSEEAGQGRHASAEG